MLPSLLFPFFLTLISSICLYRHFCCVFPSLFPILISQCPFLSPLFVISSCCIFPLYFSSRDISHSHFSLSFLLPIFVFFFISIFVFISRLYFSCLFAFAIPRGNFLPQFLVSLSCRYFLFKIFCCQFSLQFLVALSRRQYSSPLASALYSIHCFCRQVLPSLS